MNNKRSKIIKLFPETSKQLIEPQGSEFLNLFAEIITPFILCVDDESAVAESVSEYLNNQGFGTLTAQSAEEAMDLLAEYHFDIVMTDVMMPGMSGLEFTRWIKSSYDTDVIIFTGYKKNCNYDKAIELGASDFWYKPFKLSDMLNSVREIIKIRLRNFSETNFKKSNQTSNHHDLIEFKEIGNETERVKTRINEVADAAMKQLMEKGVPYHEGIVKLIKDLEFHCLQNGDILSSIQNMKMYMVTDVRIHSEALSLTYAIGKRVFHYWAETFHNEAYIKAMYEVFERNSLYWESKNIVRELKILFNEIQ